MTKNSDVDLKEAADTDPRPVIDPTQTGITHLRAIDPGAMYLWKVKGPKGAASTIGAVLLDIDDVPTVRLVHQFEGGKFKVFGVI